MTSSTRFARPFQTFRTTVIPSYSAHSVDPASGCTSRLTCVFQVPMWKSKSCSPFVAEATGEGPGLGKPGLSCASPCTGTRITINPRRSSHDRTPPGIIIARLLQELVRSPFRTPSQPARPALSEPDASWLHQVLVYELIGLGPKPEIAAERAVQGDGHEDDQADK